MSTQRPTKPQPRAAATRRTYRWPGRPFRRYTTYAPAPSEQGATSPGIRDVLGRP